MWEVIFYDGKTNWITPNGSHGYRFHDYGSPSPDTD